MSRRTNPSTFYTARELRHNPTEAEMKLWVALRRHNLGGIHFRRQHAIDRYIVDFCSPRLKLIIELDGKPHRHQKEYDIERTALLESKGYIVLRFWNATVMNDLEGVLIAILEAVESIQSK